MKEERVCVREKEKKNGAANANTVQKQMRKTEFENTILLVEKNKIAAFENVKYK